jgi:hypothetical protein
MPSRSHRSFSTSTSTLLASSAFFMTDLLWPWTVCRQLARIAGHDGRDDLVVEAEVRLAQDDPVEGGVTESGVSVEQADISVFAM